MIVVDSSALLAIPFQEPKSKLSGCHCPPRAALLAKAIFAKCELLHTRVAAAA